MQEPGLLESLVLKLFTWMATTINAVPNLPTTGLDHATTAVTWMLNLVSAANILIPVADIFLILSLVMAYRAAAFALFVANWCIRRVLDAIP